MSENTQPEAPETGAVNNSNNIVENEAEAKPSSSKAKGKAPAKKGKGPAKKGKNSGGGGRKRTAALASRDHTATTDDQKAVQNVLGRLVDWAGDNRAAVKGRLRRQDGLLPGDEGWMRTYCAPRMGGMPWTRAMIRLFPGDEAPAGYEAHEIQVRAGDDTFQLRVATLVCDDKFAEARVYYEHAWALGVHPRSRSVGPVTMWDGAVVYGGKSDDFRGRLWASTPSGPQEKYRGYLSQGAHKHTEFVLMLLSGMSLWVRAARMPDDEAVPKVIETAMLTRYKYMLNIQENGGKRFPSWLVNMDAALFGTRSGDAMRAALAMRPEDVRKRFGVPFVGVEGRAFPFKHQDLPPGYTMPDEALALATELNTPAYVKFLGTVSKVLEAAFVDELNDVQPEDPKAKSWVEVSDEAPASSNAGPSSSTPPAAQAPAAQAPPPKASRSPPKASSRSAAQHYWWPNQAAAKCAAFPLGKEHVCGFKSSGDTRFCRRHQAWLERWNAAAKTPVTN